jgi:hypothetical protein
MWHHPFSRLPLHIVDQIIDESNPHTGGKGLVHYFNHMQSWEGPVAEGAAGGWVLSGTTGAATIVPGDVPAGAIVLTADATASCNPTLQRGSASAGANFLYAVGKRMWCFARLKVGTVASTEFLFGMATPDTAPSTTGTFPSDGIFFEKAAAATKFDFHARKDGTSTEKTAASGTLVDDTYTIIGFLVDDLGNIMPYQDGAALTSSVIIAGTANIPTTGDILQPMIGILGASQTCTIDWLLFAQEL